MLWYGLGAKRPVCHFWGFIPKRRVLRRSISGQEQGAGQANGVVLGTIRSILGTVIVLRMSVEVRKPVCVPSKLPMAIIAAKGHYVILGGKVLGNIVVVTPPLVGRVLVRAVD